MTYNAALRAYCRSVGKLLRLPKRRKKAILAGLRQELEERFQGANSVTLEEISKEIGTVSETADVLMEGVPPEELERYRVWHKRLTGCVIAILVLLLVASVSLFVYTQKSQIVRAEETIVVNSVSIKDYK